jgi:hypothetical protein
MPLITYKINNLFRSDSCPLYFHHPEMDGPSGAYVQLSENGVVSANPSSFHLENLAEYRYRLSLRWDVLPYIRGDALAAFLCREEIRKLFERVLAGHEIDWYQGQRFGFLRPDAKKAFEELQTELDTFADTPGATMEVFGAHTFLFSESSLSQVWSEQECLEEAVEKVLRYAYTHNAFIQDDVAECILDEAERHLMNGWHGLTMRQLEELVKRGRIEADEATEYANEFIETHPVA